MQDAVSERLVAERMTGVTLSETFCLIATKKRELPSPLVFHQAFGHTSA